MRLLGDAMTTTEEVKLKPCPFCGDSRPFLLKIREDVIGCKVLSSELFYIRCHVCGTATSRKYHFKQDAIEFWNTRHN